MTTEFRGGIMLPTIGNMRLPWRIIGPWYVVTLLGFAITVIGLLGGKLLLVWVGLALFAIVIVVGIPILAFIAERRFLASMAERRLRRVGNLGE